MNLEQVVAAIESRAVDNTDGHVTIYRFTSGWKATWGTPDIYTEPDNEYVRRIPAASTMQDALADLLDRVDADDDPGTTRPERRELPRCERCGFLKVDCLCDDDQ